MISVRVVHYTSKVYKDGTSPIMVQVVIGGKAIRRSVPGCRLLPKHWDADKLQVRGTHPLYLRLNIAISEARYSLEKRLLSIVELKLTVTEELLFSKATLGDTLLTSIDAYIAAAKNVGTRRFRESFKRKLCRYTKGKDLPIGNIDERWIHGFVAHLQSNEVGKKGSGNAPNTVRKALASLQSTISSYSTSKDNPVRGVKKMHEKVVRQKLSREELAALFNAELSGAEKLTRDVFKFSVYLRGMRIADVLQVRLESFLNGRLSYKTGKDLETHDILLTGKAAQLVAEYAGGRESGYLFPLLRFTYNPSLTQDENAVLLHKCIGRSTTIVNKQLKKIAQKCGIEKKLTTHIARHSFAMLADKAGVPVTDIQKMLGHSSVATTAAYLADLRETDLLDKLAGGVLGDI